MHPIDLWNEYELIFDGSIIQIDKSTNPATYHISVNQVFKGNDKTSLISAQGNTILSTGDRALFYINKFNATYYIAPYSITVSRDCDARDLIPLSTLPGEPIGRGGPTLEFLIDHPCKPSYFKSRLSPLQQFKSGIVAHAVTCKQGFELLIKSTDGSPACVKPMTTEKLVQRGWGTKEFSLVKTQVENYQAIDIIGTVDYERYRTPGHFAYCEHFTLTMDETEKTNLVNITSNIFTLYKKIDVLSNDAVVIEDPFNKLTEDIKGKKIHVVGSVSKEFSSECVKWNWDESGQHVISSEKESNPVIVAKIIDILE